MKTDFRNSAKTVKAESRNVILKIRSYINYKKYGRDKICVFFIAQIIFAKLEKKSLSNGRLFIRRAYANIYIVSFSKVFKKFCITSGEAFFDLSFLPKYCKSHVITVP